MSVGAYDQLTFLPTKAVDELVEELVATLRAAVSIDNLWPVSQLLVEWRQIRFADNQVATGWEQLCAQAVGDTRRAWEAIAADPRPKPPSERHHQLKHTLATRAYRGRVLEQWQYEVTGGGRIWYLIDDATHTVWLTYAGTGIPRQPTNHLPPAVNSIRDMIGHAIPAG